MANKKKVKNGLKSTDKPNLTFVPLGPFVLDWVNTDSLNEIPVFSPASVIDRRELRLVKKMNR